MIYNGGEKEEAGVNSLVPYSVDIDKYKNYQPATSVCNIDN